MPLLPRFAGDARLTHTVDLHKRLEQMKHDIPYKNYLIRGESFQPTQSSGWIPRYVLQRANLIVGADDLPLSHDRLDKAFGSKSEADDFAVQDAKNWIDKLDSATVDVASPEAINGGLYVVNKPTA